MRATRVWTIAALVAAAVFTTASNLSAALNRWTTAGPEGARIFRIVGGTESDEPVFALSPDAGVFKTTDRGANWTFMNEGLPSIVATLYRAADGTLYASSGGQIFVRRNDATTWEASGTVPEVMITAFAVDTDSDTVYAATGRGIYTSLDGGRTWLAPTSFTSEVLSLAMAPNGKAYAIITYPTYGWVLTSSIDQGASWQIVKQAPELPSDLLIDPHTGAIVLRSKGVVYSSGDGGFNWTSLGNDGVPKGFVLGPLSLSSAGRIVSTVNVRTYEHDEIARGKWVAVGNQLPASYLSLLVTSSSPRVFYAATEAGIFTRTEPDQTWVERNHGIPAAVADVAIADSQPSTAYLASAAGVFATHDSGETWTHIYADLPAQHVATTSDPNIVHAGVTNRLIRTTNGGQTWDKVAPGQISGLATSRSSPGTLYAAFATTVFKSTDGGATFKTAGVGLPTFFYGYYYSYFYFEGIAADSANMNTAYASFIDGTYKTTNGGDWTRISDHYHGRIALDPQDSATIYASRGTGVDRSTDGAVTWQDIGLADKQITTIAASREAVYAGSSDGHVYRSTDRGEHWAALPDGLTASSLSKLSVDTSDSTLFAATNAGAWVYGLLHNNPAITSATVDADRLQRLLSSLDNSPGAGFIAPAAAAAQGVTGRFTSSAFISNRRNSPQDVIAVWLPQAYAGVVYAYRFLLPARSAVALDDVGPDLGLSGIGSLAVVGVNGNGDIDPTADIDGSVTINMQPPGGLAPHAETIAAFHSAAFSPRSARGVTGLRNDASTRTNVGVVNLSANFRQFTITVTGERATDHFAIVVPPFSVVQTRLPQPDYGALSLDVTSDDAAARWLLYASAVDNNTGDARTSIGR
jgi:photosystem II stability/assembly factor-like uncharacterized protein